MKQSSIPTANPDWGFFGTIRHHADPDEAWPLAMEAIGAATACPLDAVRDFLDSRNGRHFADTVADGPTDGATLNTAIDRAVARWMSWTIDRRTARAADIPAGLPYLAGFVIAEEIALEAAS
jgi:hypothetical protein